MRFRGHGSRNEREVERCGRGDGDLRAMFHTIFHTTLRASQEGWLGSTQCSPFRDPPKPTPPRASRCAARRTLASASASSAKRISVPRLNARMPAAW